jgi:choice-of-anchor C domain-containing protein
LNPGNSGGPVLDGSGKVVGVVVAGVTGARVNFAIPVSHVSRFVEKPEIRFDPPTLNRLTVNRPVLFQARVLTILPSPRPPELELILRSGREKEHRYKMELVDGVHNVMAGPITKPVGRSRVRISLEYSDGFANGLVEDRPFKVGGRECNLREVRRFQFGDKHRAVLTGGNTLEGRISGLEAVPVQFGGETVVFNFLKAVDAQLSPAGGFTTVACTVVATQGGKEVGRLTKLVGSNLLVNGSFEEGPEPERVVGYVVLGKGSSALKGWEVTRGNIDYVGPYFQPADGNRCLDLNGFVRGGIAQPFKTQKGQRYRVTFSMAGNPNSAEGPAVKKLGVSAAGTSAEFEFDTTGKSYQDMGWVTKTWEFVAVADQTTLEFYSLTGVGCGPTLDNVSVVEVIE